MGLTKARSPSSSGATECCGHRRRSSCDESSENTQTREECIPNREQIGLQLPPLPASSARCVHGAKKKVCLGRKIVWIADGAKPLAQSETNMACWLLLWRVGFELDRADLFMQSDLGNLLCCERPVSQKNKHLMRRVMNIMRIINNFGKRWASSTSTSLINNGFRASNSQTKIQRSTRKPGNGACFSPL